MQLYYLTTAEYAISNLVFGRLKISRIKDLNDPFEFASLSLPNELGRKAAREERDRAHDSWGIISFSRRMNNPVMWSHYGDRHRGICLGFEVAPGIAEPCIYSPDRVALQYDADGLPTNYDADAFKKQLLTKFEDWRYEQEYRALFPIEKDFSEAGLYFMYFHRVVGIQLREVILGTQCNLQIGPIQALVKQYEQPVMVRQARLAFKSFTVVRQRLQP